MQDSGTTEIRFAGGAQGFNWLPVFVAKDQSLLEKNGIAIDFLRVGSVEKATKAVLDGEADLAISPPEGAIANFVEGGELRLVAANAVRLPMSVMAQPAIKTVEDLKGKVVGTSSLTEGTAIYTQILLERHGLHYPGDYEFALSGIHQKRWDDLQSGAIDCAPQPAPWNFLAEDAGYSRLAEVHEVIPEILFTAVMGRVGWLRENAGTVRRLLRALVEAHDITNDPECEEITAPIFQRITTPDDQGLALRGLRFMRDMGMWPPGLEIPKAALETTIDLMIRANLMDPDKRDHAPGVFDPAYLSEASSSEA